MIAVAERLRSMQLHEPTRAHSEALLRRLAISRGLSFTPEDPNAWAAGLEYLAARVEAPELPANPVAERHALPAWRLVRVLDDLRECTKYRSYVGEWIRGESIVEDVLEFEIPDLLAEDDEDAPWLPEWDEEDEQLSFEPPVEGIPAPRAPVDLASPSGVSDTPSLWKAPFLPYAWQREAAAAWEANNGRGIVQVVTGAGKTALALLIYLRVLEQVRLRGERMQLVVVVPRIELARQWEREVRRIVSLKGLRLGRYHSGHRCRPERQDILVITQDSARSVLPTLWLDRPVMLVADECHRLGAPAASRILHREYTWTLGLSATPERVGDSAFETILVPRLGPVVYKYGYQDAVRDAIIAPFRILRVKVPFTVDEQERYDARSEKITRLLQYLKGRYPELRKCPPARFWQVMGDLRNKHPEDDAFEVLTAMANERRAIVHFAAEKYAAVRHVARVMGNPRRVLCFHERIEAADKLRSTCTNEGRQPVVFHSQMSEPARAAALSAFREGRADWLIACRSLDEGLDIPAVDTIVIVAGTKSPRQLIQRLGRALRRKQEERTALVVLLEVAGVDDELLEHEGVAELREAAEEVRSIELGDLPVELLAPPVRSSRTIGVVSAEAQPRPRAPKPDTPRFAPFKAITYAATQVLRRFGSWTGTAGNKSYYDKDESPD